MRRRRRRGLHDPLRLHPCPPCPDPLRPGLHPLTPPPPPPFPILLASSGTARRCNPPDWRQSSSRRTCCLFARADATWIWGGPSPGPAASLFSTVESHAHPAPQGAQHGSGGRVLYPGSSEPGSRGIPAARLGGLFTQVPLSYRSPSPRHSWARVNLGSPTPGSCEPAQLTPDPYVHGPTEQRTPG